jgi:hypothetical protein
MAPLIIAGVAALASAYMAYEQGQDAKEIAKKNQTALNQTASDNLEIARQNREVAEREAVEIYKRGYSAIDMKRKEISRLLAYQRTQEAVSGFRYEGTVLSVANQSIFEGEQDVATIWANAVADAEMVTSKGNIAYLQGQRSADKLRVQGDIVAQQGVNAAQAGIYQGASTLLRGISNAYLAYRPQTYSSAPSNASTSSNMKIGGGTNTEFRIGSGW